MSFCRNYVKMTSFWRNNDVIITSCVQGGLQDLLFICNSTLKTNDADMRQWTGSPLRQVMTRCLFGTHLNQYWLIPLQRRHNERDGVSNHRLLDCFAQLFVYAQIKGNIKALRHWPLYGESTDDRWISLTKCQWHGRCPFDDGIMLNWTLGKKTSVNIHIFFSRNCLWICRLQNFGHFVLA